MASGCLGNPGIHRGVQTASKAKISDRKNYPEVVWIKKRYVTVDLRTIAPVPRHKLLLPSAKSLPRPEAHWIKSRAPLAQAFQAAAQGSNPYISQPSTRCEDWSTLTQSLPSVGQPLHRKPPNWGTDHTLAPLTTPRVITRCPHINSPMTRYVDAMHLTNRLFSLH